MSALPATHAPRLKLAIVLALATAVSVLALFPYLMMLMPMQLATAPVSPAVLAGAQALQAGVLAGLLSWLGLWLGERYGLATPWLRAWVYRLPHPQLPHQWRWASLLGVVAAVVVLAIDTQQHGGTGHAAVPRLLDSAWRGALASLYGGIVEEVLFRLLLVSLLVWLLARLGNGVQPWMFVVSIVLAALLFGAGHLPAAFSSGMPHGL